jgi:hypothetical protein
MLGKMKERRTIRQYTSQDISDDLLYRRAGCANATKFYLQKSFLIKSIFIFLRVIINVLAHQFDIK